VAIEDELARDIVGQLRPHLSGDTEKRLARTPAADPEAYRLYLMGRHHWNKRTQDGMRRSIELFQQAIDRAPAFALAYIGMADAYINLGAWCEVPPREAYPRARAAATRALALDEGLAEAHISLAQVRKQYEWDWEAARRSFLRGLELNPNYSIGHFWYGEWLAGRGLHAEAIASLQKALDLDPLSPMSHAALGWYGYSPARQFDRAAEQYRKALELDASFWVGHHFLGWLSVFTGRLEEALAEFEAARRLDSNPEIVAGIGHVHGLAGRREEALAMLEELKRRSTRSYVSPILSAQVWIGLGDRDQAFAWIDKALADRAPWLSEILTDPVYDRLRPGPRFNDVLRQVGLLS
jgi:tetratricopeptide (TPR) repeat protein